MSEGDISAQQKLSELYTIEPELTVQFEIQGIIPPHATPLAEHRRLVEQERTLIEEVAIEPPESYKAAVEDMNEYFVSKYKDYRITISDIHAFQPYFVHKDNARKLVGTSDIRGYVNPLIQRPIIFIDPLVGPDFSNLYTLAHEMSHALSVRRNAVKYKGDDKHEKQTLGVSDVSLLLEEAVAHTDASDYLLQGHFNTVRNIHNESLKNIQTKVDTFLNELVFYETPFNSILLDSLTTSRPNPFQTSIAQPGHAGMILSRLLEPLTTYKQKDILKYLHRARVRVDLGDHDKAFTILSEHWGNETIDKLKNIPYEKAAMQKLLKELETTLINNVDKPQSNVYTSLPPALRGIT